MQNEKTNWVTQKRKADADIETTTKSCCGFGPLCEKIVIFVLRTLIHFGLQFGALKDLEKIMWRCGLKIEEEIVWPLGPRYTSKGRATIQASK